MEDVLLSGESTRGIGIPSGAGLIYYPNQTVEAIRYPSIEFQNTNATIRRLPIRLKAIQTA